MQGPRAILIRQGKNSGVGQRNKASWQRHTYTTTSKIWQNLNISLGKSGMLLHSFCRMVQVKSIYVNVT